MALPTEKAGTLETNQCQIVPTAIGLSPPSGLSNGVKGALAMNSLKTLGHFPANKRLTTPVTEANNSSINVVAAPLNASIRYCACKPSRPQEVLWENS